jgi:hypothetical protein
MGTWKIDVYTLAILPFNTSSYIATPDTLPSMFLPFPLLSVTLFAICLSSPSLSPHSLPSPVPLTVGSVSKSRGAGGKDGVEVLRRPSGLLSLGDWVRVQR